MPEYKSKAQKMKFYKSRAWRTLRLEALVRDNYECQQCKRQGKFSKGQNVHHIKEIYYHAELALEIDNLETLCIQCHNIEHERIFSKVNGKRNAWNDEWW